MLIYCFIHLILYFYYRFKFYQHLYHPVLFKGKCFYELLCCSKYFYLKHFPCNLFTLNKKSYILALKIFNGSLYLNQ